MQRIAPGTPIIKKGSIPESLILIITGTVDALDNGDIPTLRYAAGSLIGEEEFLTHNPSVCTYRSRNHVKALRIPADLFVHALSKSKKIEGRLKILKGRRYLSSGLFPGHVVSCPRLDEIAAEMKERSWRKGKRINPVKDELYILKKGSVVETGINGDRILKEGGWLNLQSILPFAEKQDKVSWMVRSASTVAVLPGQLVREAPVLAWTLAESRPYLDD